MTQVQVVPFTPESLHDLVERTLSVLAEDGLVAVPTETVYGIGGRADRPAAVQKLLAFKSERAAQPFTLHVGAAADAFELGRGPAQARRLARAYWPGPLTLVLDATAAGEPFCVPGNTTLGFRVVAHGFTGELCRRAPAPLLLSSANRSGGEPATNAEDAARAVGDAVELIVDGGPCPVAKPSTVVRVDASGAIRILREGALDERSVLARAASLILFVCSGNTCRSPMAEAIAKQRWAAGLGIEPTDLPRHGILVASAGTSALPGLPASEHAVQAAAELGLDLSGHRTRAIEPALLARASRIYCMGPSHVQTVAAVLDDAGGSFEEDAAPPELLATDEEIFDPFGGDLETYRQTLTQIAAAIPDQAPLGPRL